MRSIWRASHQLICLSIYLTLSKAVSAETVENDTNHHPPIALGLIGGEIIKKGQWPWLVSLKSKVVIKKIFGILPVYRETWCGGSLIADQWVMSAAHCFFDDNSDEIPAKFWKARLASSSLKSNLWEKVKNIFGRIFKKIKWLQWNVKVAKILIFPDYSEKDINNDMALVKLAQPVPTKLLSTMKPVKLPQAANDSFPRPGMMCIMTGWGCTQVGGSVTKIATRIDIPIMSNLQCSNYFGNLNKNKICSGFFNHAKGLCKGDSGGPLVCSTPQGWIQVGVASFMRRDDPKNYPGVFTRVSVYRDWIDKTIKENS